MANKTFLGVIFGGAVVYWAYKKYIFANAVSFMIHKVQLQGSFFNPVINLDLMITNKSNVTSTISNIQAARARATCWMIGIMRALNSSKFSLLSTSVLWVRCLRRRLAKLRKK